jgi:hypothetical protein
VKNLSYSDRNEINEQYLAIYFILGGDYDRFGKVIDNLQNDLLQGCNGLPKTVSTGYQFNAPRDKGVPFATSTTGEP